MNELYEMALQQMTTEDFLSADIHPCEYLLPYARLICEHYDSLLGEQYLYDINSNTKKPIQRPVRLHQKLILVQQELDHNLRTLRSRMLGIGDSTGSWKVQDLCKDMEATRDLCRDLASDSMQNTTFILAWKVTVDAEKVNRLTQLAVVFVPLSFVTSLFSMNIAPLHDGQTNVWIPIVAAAAVYLCVGLALLAGQARSERFWRRT